MKRGRTVAVIAVIAAGGAGCAAPLRLERGAAFPTREPGSDVSPDEVFGYQADVITPQYRYRGEFLACDQGGLYLRLNVYDGATYVRVAWSEVERASVALANYAAGVGTWTALGTLSSISHGYFVVFSAPTWLGVGVPSAILSQPRVQLQTCDSVRQYSRFPQGLPPVMQRRFENLEAPPSGWQAPAEMQLDPIVIEPAPAPVSVPVPTPEPAPAEVPPIRVAP